MKNLECSVCFGSYNNEGKRPRVLPCGHTFCSSCISDNLLSGEIKCPHCRNLHRANSNAEFPPNFDLEKVIEYHPYNFSDRMETCDLNPVKWKALSKNLRIQIAEANFRVEILSNKSREISSHLQQYNFYIDEGLSEYEHILHHHDIIDMSFKKESSRVSDSITEEENKRTKMEKARILLASAGDTTETLLALEEVNIRCDDLERWNQITTEIFPKENLMTSVKEIRLLSKEIPLRFSECGQKGIKDKDEAAEEEMEKEERDTEEDNQDLKPSQYQDLMLRDVEVKENQETCTDEPLKKAYNAFSSQTIQDKVLDDLQKIPPWKVDKAIQTDESVYDKTIQIIQSGLNGNNKAITIAFMWIPITLFTIIYLTSCLHTAWVEWVDVSYTLSVEDLLEMTPLARHMLDSNRVFAVHEDGRGEAGRRYARISLEEANSVYLHVLEKISTESLPKDAIILQFDDVIEKVEVFPQYTFLELGVGGGKDGERSLGKLIIHLVPQSKISLNFFLLCTGQMGPSYTNSSLLELYDKDTILEYVSFGDYETNNGEGGKAVVPGGINWRNQHVYHNQEPCEKGMVTWDWNIQESTASMFEIFTGNYAEYKIVKDGVIGTVVEGLHILSKAINDYESITDVKVIDTGVILPPKICRSYIGISNR